MPEGDTIHRHAAMLRQQMVGQVVTTVRVRGLEYRRLAGQTISAANAQGKHLLIDVGDARIHVHLGMNGRLRMDSAAHATPAMMAGASLVIATPTLMALWWRAPTVEVLRASFAHAHPVLRALGPDILSPDFASGDVVSRARTLPTATEIGELLLNQRVACGIGNVYKSEVLFLLGLSPVACAAELDDVSLSRIFDCARDLMQKNLGPWRRTTTTDLTAGGFGPVGSARVFVYRRAGHPCRKCGTAIAVMTQGDPPRKTYYCPRCQTTPRTSPASSAVTSGPGRQGG